MSGLSGLNPDVTDLMLRSILGDIKEVVEKEIVEKLVSDFRAQAEEMVKEYTEGLTIERLESFKDVANLRSNLYVKLDMGGGNVTNHVI